MIPGEAPKGDQKRQPSGVIPEAAVEAAANQLWPGGTKEQHRLRNVRAALEAAAPIMRQAFYLEINLRAVQDELARPLFPLGKIEDKRRNGDD